MVSCQAINEVGMGEMERKTITALTGEACPSAASATMIIIIIAVVVVLIGGGGVFAFWYRRNRNSQQVAVMPALDPTKLPDLEEGSRGGLLPPLDSPGSGSSGGKVSVMPFVASPPLSPATKKKGH